MVRNREEFVEYLCSWGCPDSEVDEVIDSYFSGNEEYPVNDVELDDWLECMGFLVTEVRWYYV